MMDSGLFVGTWKLVAWEITLTWERAVKHA